MAVYNILPKTGFTAEDIVDTLNANGGNVTGEAVTWFQDRANINMWSKYKPIKYPKDFDITDEEFRNEHFGLNISEVMSGNIGGNREWTYSLPSGGKSSPYRLEDFRGYSPASIPPVEVNFPSEIYKNSPEYNKVYIDIDEDMGSSNLAPNNVRVKDLFYSRMNYYIGVLIYNVTRNSYLWRTAGVPLSSWVGNETLVPLLPSWTAGDRLRIYAIISSQDYTGDPFYTPGLPVMFYLTPDSNIGYKELYLTNRNIVIEDIELQSKNIRFDKVRDYDISDFPYVYRVFEISGTAYNKSSKTYQITFEASVDDEEGSGYSWEFTKQTKQLTTHATASFISYPPNGNNYIKIRADWTDYAYITIYGGIPNGTREVLYSGEFNFETQQWS